MSDQFRKQLEEYKKKNDIKTPNPKKKKRKPKTEKFSQKEIKSLMGIDRPTYRRGKGGSIKQR